MMWPWNAETFGAPSGPQLRESCGVCWALRVSLGAATPSSLLCPVCGVLFPFPCVQARVGGNPSCCLRARGHHPRHQWYGVLPAPSQVSRPCSHRFGVVRCWRMQMCNQMWLLLGWRTRWATRAQWACRCPSARPARCSSAVILLVSALNAAHQHVLFTPLKLCLPARGFESCVAIHRVFVVLEGI